MSHTILKVSDLDCDFQGQIGLQTSKIIILTVKHSTASNFILQLEMFFKHLNVSDRFENWRPCP